jgi:hypothetical protein
MLTKYCPVVVLKTPRVSSVIDTAKSVIQYLPTEVMETTLPVSLTEDVVLFWEDPPAENVTPKLLDDQFVIIEPPPPEQ